MKILITGGLGFIGINAAKYFSTDNEIHIVDNVSRKGNMENYETISNNKNIKVYNVILNDKIEKLNWYQMKNTGDSIFREKTHYFKDCEIIC